MLFAPNIESISFTESVFLLRYLLFIFPSYRQGKLSLTKQHHIQRKQETEPKVAITNAPPSSDVPLIPSSPPLPQDTQVDTALVPVTPNRDTMSISEPFRHKLCVVSGCTARCLPPTNYCFARKWPNFFFLYSLPL